jgi:hypothetical protein
MTDDNAMTEDDYEPRDNVIDEPIDAKPLDVTFPDDDNVSGEDDPSVQREEVEK